MRKSIITDLGINVPGINFKDNTSFRPRGRYIIRIKGAKAAEGVLKSGYLLALKTPNVMADLDAEPAKDPIFGEDGYWILDLGAYGTRCTNERLSSVRAAQHINYAFRCCR